MKSNIGSVFLHARVGDEYDVQSDARVLGAILFERIESSLKNYVVTPQCHWLFRIFFDDAIRAEPVGPAAQVDSEW